MGYPRNTEENDFARQDLAAVLDRLADPDPAEALVTIMPEDNPTGYIYVLRSLSTHPKIADIHNLHKIGITKRIVEQRIKNAKDKPTYLMAPSKSSRSTKWKPSRRKSPKFRRPYKLKAQDLLSLRQSQNGQLHLNKRLPQQ